MIWNSLALLLLIFPREIIESTICRVGRFSRDNVYFYFSGRVAIASILRQLGQSGDTVLVPDYICDVVYKACDIAGFKVVAYPLNDKFEPDLETLKGLVEIKKPRFLLIAPIYGADGGVSWLYSKSGKSWMQEKQIFVLFDLCQDFSRLVEMQKSLLPNSALIGSFNNKSFPGVMGGIVISESLELKPPFSTFSDSLRIFYLWIVVGLRSFLKRIVFSDSVKRQVSAGRLKFSFSLCKKFPYDFNHDGATKLQIILGLIGIIRLKNFAKRKEKYFVTDGSIIVKTPFWKTSPYLICRQDSSSHRLKPPYSLPNDYSESLRPDLIVRHFKGYDDF